MSLVNLGVNSGPVIDPSCASVGIEAFFVDARHPEREPPFPIPSLYGFCCVYMVTGHFVGNWFTFNVLLQTLRKHRFDGQIYTIVYFHFHF